MSIATSPIFSGFSGRGFNFPANNKIIFEGDSRIYGFPFTISDAFSILIQNAFTVQNVGESGDTMAGCVTDYVPQVLPKFNAALDNNFLLASAGGNDIQAYTPVSTIIEDTRKYHLRAAMDAFRPIAATIALGSGPYVGFNPYAIEFNNWIKANWKSTGAVALADFDAVINPAETVDGIHYSDPQIYAVAGVVKNIVANLLGKPAKTNLIVLESDYRFQGVGAALDAITSYPVFDVGTNTAPGIPTMTGEINSQVAPLFNASLNNNYALISGGSVDILSGQTAAQAYTNLLAWVNAVYALGFKPIMTTILPVATYNIYYSTLNTPALAFNELIRNGWQSSNAVGMVDVAKLPTINIEEQTSGAFLTAPQAAEIAKAIRAIIVQNNLN